MTTTTRAEETGGTAATKDRKEFPCDSCGASLVFSIGAQRLKCDHCGFEKALEFDEGQKPSVSENDLEAGLQAQAEKRAGFCSTALVSAAVFTIYGLILLTFF